MYTCTGSQVIVHHTQSRDTDRASSNMSTFAANVYLHAVGACIWELVSYEMSM